MLEAGLPDEGPRHERPGRYSGSGRSRWTWAGSIDGTSLPEALSVKGGGKKRGGTPARGNGGLITILNRVMPDGGESDWNKQEKLVAIAIAKRMGGKLEAWPGVGTIAQMSGVCRDSVHKALKRLCGPNGLFKKRRRGRGSSNLYVVSPSLMSDKLDISGATSEPPRPTETPAAGSDSPERRMIPGPPESGELSSETLLPFWPPDPPARRSRSKRVVARHPNLVPDVITQLRERLSKTSVVPPNDDEGTRERGA